MGWAPKNVRLVIEYFRRLNGSTPSMRRVRVLVRFGAIALCAFAATRDVRAQTKPVTKPVTATASAADTTDPLQRALTAEIRNDVKAAAAAYHSGSQGAQQRHRRRSSRDCAAGIRAHVG